MFQNLGSRNCIKGQAQTHLLADFKVHHTFFTKSGHMWGHVGEHSSEKHQMDNPSHVSGPQVVAGGAVRMDLVPYVLNSRYILHPR